MGVRVQVVREVRAFGVGVTERLWCGRWRGRQRLQWAVRLFAHRRHEAFRVEDLLAAVAAEQLSAVLAVCERQVCVVRVRCRLLWALMGVVVGRCGGGRGAWCGA